MTFRLLRATRRFALAALLTMAGAAHAAASKPNIVLIITDDQGYGDLGVHGNPVLETPHLDALARGGAALKHFYVSPVCSPTRASLHTGRYHFRTRVVDTFKGRSMMEPDEVTLPELLRGAGYATGIFGKWHLGDNYPMRATDQGFETALTIRGGGLGQPSDPIENQRRYTDPIVFRNNRQEQAKGYCTDVFFDGALAFIREAQQARRPFFAYVALNAPHDPLHDVPPALYAKYKGKYLSPVLVKGGNDADSLARVYAMVENIDQNVGRLMAVLRAQRAVENTLVIFMSDNGPAAARYVAGLRGRKGQVYEGGIRSPFFASWPGRIKAGTAPEPIAAHIDVMPTLLEVAGIAPPAALKLDGRSLLPLLENRARAWEDRALIFQYHRGEEPLAWHNVAVRTQRWKLVHSTGREASPVEAPFELYDLEADPAERTDLAATQPAVVERLRTTYQRWYDDVRTTRPDNFQPPRIVVGSEQAATTVLTRQDWRLPENAPGGRAAVGHWLLRAERNATYSLELRWPAPIAAGTAEIRVGSTTRSVPVPAATDRVIIEDLRISAGDCTFTALVQREGSRDGAYHATLVRR